MVERVTELKALGVVLDKRLSSKIHIRSITASASSKLRILKKDLSLIDEKVLVWRVFWLIMLPVFVYCFLV